MLIKRHVKKFRYANNVIVILFICAPLKCALSGGYEARFILW